MTDHELDCLWVGAFRYYLGRATYAVSDFCDLLVKQKAILPERTKNLIVQEAYQAISLSKAGHDMDRKCWENVVKEFDD